MTQKHADLFSGTGKFLVGVASSPLAFLPHSPLVSSSHDPGLHGLLIKTLWLVRYEGFLYKEKGRKKQKEEYENVLHWHWRCQDPSCQSCASMGKINDSAQRKSK